MLSMKDLIIQTGEAKSTIHYYLKEGLLPEPKKIKANVHHYEEECVNIIKFIKHLQNSFSYSISEIKNILELNKFDFSSSFVNLIASLEIMSGSNDNIWFTRDELLVAAEISEEDLIYYEKNEFIFQRANGYSNKEFQMIQILKKAEELNIDFRLFSEYVQKAKEVARLEYEIGAQLLTSNNNEDHNQDYELIFEILLSLKPYLFNVQTVKVHKKLISENN